MDEKQNFEIIQRDALEALQELPDAAFDALVADPPYCSGGITPAKVASGGLRKYVETTRNGSFADSMSQFALYDFLRVIILRAREKLKSPGYLFLFTDWRSLPVMASAMQDGGAIWRGVVTWNKGNSRPNPGGISQTAEFILWGTKDEKKSDKIVTNSVVTVSPPAVQKRVHPTQKPVELYRALFKILPDNPRVIDIFMGSAPAGVATLDANGYYCGVDNSGAYCANSRERLNAAAARLF